MATQPPTQTGTHHFILTLQVPAGAGAQMSTFNNTITPPTGWTRAKVYQSLYNDVRTAHPELAGAVTVFFSLERNEL